MVQIKEVLGMFERNNLVLQEPANTIVITIYCTLVAVAGKIVSLR